MKKKSKLLLETKDHPFPTRQSVQFHAMWNKRIYVIYPTILGNSKPYKAFVTLELLDFRYNFKKQKIYQNKSMCWTAQNDDNVLIRDHFKITKVDVSKSIKSYEKALFKLTHHLLSNNGQIRKEPNRLPQGFFTDEELMRKTDRAVLEPTEKS